jgi:hypothetical protein
MKTVAGTPEEAKRTILRRLLLGPGDSRRGGQDSEEIFY